MRLLLLFLFCMLRVTKPLRNALSVSTWSRDWELIRTMRSSITAPVDTMGAESLADKSDGFGTPQFRFRTLIATMLSPQTKDKQTRIALNNLLTMVKPNLFLPSSLLAYNADEIQQQIKGVSFAKTKSNNILAAASTCVEVYGDDIPLSIDKLLLLRGVGPKIAYLTFSIAFNQHLGIVVDTHVHRIANRLGWVQSNSPEQTRNQLEAIIPQEHWMEVNNLLVGFGQTVCAARLPKCGTCLLNSTCPFRLATVSDSKK